MSKGLLNNPMTGKEPKVYEAIIDLYLKVKIRSSDEVSSKYFFLLDWTLYRRSAKTRKTRTARNWSTDIAWLYKNFNRDITQPQIRREQKGTSQTKGKK